MIRIFFDSPDDQYSPNSGKALHLVNQVGQDNFKLDGYIFAANTDVAVYAASWNVKQALLSPDDKEVSAVVTDVPVSIPAGGQIALSPLRSGSIPMKGIDTMKTSYRYRVCIKRGEEVISDTVTGVFFNETDTVFNAPTVPFVAGGGIVIDGNSTAAIAAEIVRNDAELAVLPVEIKVRQTRLTTLSARNSALKAVPALVPAV